MTRPAGAGARRAGAAAAAALLALLGALAGVPARAADAAGAVQVSVDTLTPAVATSGSTMLLAGTVADTGPAVRNATLRLRLSTTRLNSRAELGAVAAGRVSSRDGSVVAQLPLGDLSRGSRTPYELRQPLDEVPALTESGVYALSLEVVGTRSGRSGRVAITRTLLPWVPASPGFKPTGFAWLWPLAGTPVRLASGLFANDSLARELAPGGRLARLLTAGDRLQQGAAVTWALDPELIEAVADMADGYFIATPEGGRVPGGGVTVAQSWLEELRRATAGAQVLPLPYADPDLVALVRHGQPGLVAQARDAGAETLAGLLPAATTVDDLAWPVDGYVNRATLAALVRSGVSSVVLDGRAMPPTIDLSYTPSGRAQLTSGGRRVAALLADPVLADLLAGAQLESADPVLAAQRVVAETAMITSELPNSGDARTVVVMPPRRWAPREAFLDQLVSVGQAPWAAPVSLRALATQSPPEVDRGRLRYPRAEARAELPRSYLTAVDAVQGTISNFAAILTDPTAVVPSMTASVRRLMSSAWRGREDRVNRLAQEQAYLAGERAKVRVQPGTFTFGSRSGTIPLTLVNDLPQEVRVALRLQPQTPRLRLGTVEEPQVVGPNQKKQVEVDATAVAGGQVVIDASLRTPGGAQYGQPVQLRVNVTQIGTVALVITVGAAVVLFLAAGFRVVRRVRGARHPADPDHPDQPDASDTPADVTA